MPLAPTGDLWETLNEKTVIRTEPLGMDRYRRKYWILATDNSRCFVESADSKSWGYYSAEDIPHVISLLNGNGLRESDLVSSLKSVDFVSSVGLNNNFNLKPLYSNLFSNLYISEMNIDYSDPFLKIMIKEEKTEEGVEKRKERAAKEKIQLVRLMNIHLRASQVNFVCLILF